MEVTAVVKGAWDAFATQITIFLPKLIGALIIFIIGLIIARSDGTIISFCSPSHVGVWG